MEKVKGEKCNKRERKERKKKREKNVFDFNQQKKLNVFFVLILHTFLFTFSYSLFQIVLCAIKIMLHFTFVICLHWFYSHVFDPVGEIHYCSRIQVISLATDPLYFKIFFFLFML